MDLPRGSALLAGLVVPALGAALLAVPATRALTVTAGSTVRAAAESALTDTLAATPTATPSAIPAPAPAGRAPRQPAKVASTWIRTTQAPMPIAPPAPARPAPPPRPWETGGESTWAPPTVAPLVGPVLGPVVRVQTTVAPGAPVVLPRGNGQPHLLCTGPTTPGALYWLDSTDAAGTKVYRYDGSGTYDFSYRDVSGEYLQTQPCA